MSVASPNDDEDTCDTWGLGRGWHLGGNETKQKKIQRIAGLK